MRRAAPILLALMIAACGTGQSESGMTEEGSGMMGDSAQAGEMGEMMGDESEMGGMMEDSSAMGEGMEPDSAMAPDTTGTGHE